LGAAGDFLAFLKVEEVGLHSVCHLPVFLSPAPARDLQVPDRLECDIPEASKMEKESGKDTINVIESYLASAGNNNSSGAGQAKLSENDVAVKSATVGDTASTKSVNMSRNHMSLTLQNAVAVTFAAAGGAALAEAAGSSGKSQADGRPGNNSLKVAKVARVSQVHGIENDAAKPQHAQVPVVGAPASDKADAVDVAASYNFFVDHFCSAIKAFDALGLKWTTRQQREIRLLATLEQRAIACLVAGRL